MTKKGFKKNRDLRLKIAILESGRTQRVVSMRARIGEVRLSKLVRNPALATTDEREALAKYLERSVVDLFPAARKRRDDDADQAVSA